VDEDMLQNNLLIHDLVGPSDHRALVLNVVSQLLSLFTVQPSFTLLSRALGRKWHLVPPLLRPIATTIE
jgi:hypothetical protein